VNRVYYQNDHENGFSWGLEGSVLGDKARLFASEIFPEKKPSYKTLLEHFPTRSKIAVWYNPKVTGTLFQRRSINVLPLTEDFPKEQYQQIFKWFMLCLFPFGLSIFLVRKILKIRP
jgi:hypothetical protein